MPRRAGLALLGAAAGVALLIITWYATFHAGIVERADQSIYRGFADLQRPRINSVAQFIADLCNPQPYVYFAAVPVVVALVRRRPRVAFGIGAILLGANLTTQLLKPLLAEPRAASLIGGLKPVAPASWPSGHATAAMSLALCLILAAPARRRPFVAALGAGFAVLVSYSFLTLGWHYPSDVFGGFLVAAVWTLLVVGALFALEAARPAGARGESSRQLSVREALGPVALALLGAAAAAGLVALARPHAVLAYARAHETFMLGAGAIGGFGLAVATVVMLALRR
jgi:membrane-associated phospholipid phosphatase